MIWILSSLIGCGEKTTDSAQPTPEPVDVTLRLLSVVDGSNISGVTVTSSLDTDTTDESGSATVRVDGNSSYAVTASDDSSMNHIYHGVTAEEAFEVIGFLVDRQTTGAVFSMMGTTQDSSNGIVVAALDNPDLSPAVGASASLSISDADPFIFGATGMPQAGNTIQSGGGSFVFFPNVPTGSVSVSGFGLDATCTVFPAGDEMHEITVQADSVHVVVFSCN